MRVVITGGAGFIGHQLASQFLDAGHDVHVVDDFRITPLAPPVGRVLARAVSDMTPRDIEKAEVIYHLAADKSVPESFLRPLDFIENVNSTTHLLSLARAVETPRVLIASTCEVYGVASTPTTEDAPLSPRSPYAQSKTAMEYVARVFQAESASTNTTIVRLFNIYGPFERPDAVVPNFCRRAIRGEPLVIEGDGNQRRDFTYVSDAVEILVEMASKAASVPVLNLGSGISYGVNEIVENLKEFVPKLKVVHATKRCNEISDFRADTTLLRDSLGINELSKRMFIEGIRDTLNWWKNNH